MNSPNQVGISEVMDMMYGWQFSRLSIRPLIQAAVAANLLAGDSRDDKKAEAQPKGHTGKTVLFALLGVGAVILLSFFIFKYWQKKKREEQHARLLKLFEEDDDIEVELGLRD